MFHVKHVCPTNRAILFHVKHCGLLNGKASCPSEKTPIYNKVRALCGSFSLSKKSVLNQFYHIARQRALNRICFANS